MPNYALVVTRTARFGIAAENILAAQVVYKIAIEDMAELIKWDEEITSIEEISDDDLVE